MTGSRGLARAVATAVLALALLPWGAGAASASALLLPDDAQTLVDHLRRASAAQGICYGWEIGVGGGGYPRSVERGSNLGVGVLPAPDEAQCRETVVLTGDVTYTDEFSELEDSADWDVRSTLAGPAIADVERVAGLNVNWLLGDDDDRAVYNAVSALPLAVVESGAAPPVPPAPAADVPPADGPDAEGGSDFLRENTAAFVLVAVLLLAGLGLMARGLLLGRSAQRGD